MRNNAARTAGLLTAFVCLATLSIAVAGAPESSPVELVVCAPGYPGNTDDAQPSMDRLAGAVARASGWAETSLTATYHATAAAGRARMQESASALALVPFSFFWAHGHELGLQPVLQVERVHGTTETWTLVAQRGRVKQPADLRNWEITGLPGYSPAFVRGPLLSHWGELPGSVRIQPTSQVLGALRRAARGDDVAVLLDPAQKNALSALPFGSDLEVVTRSPELPGFVLCTVDARLDGDRTRMLQRGLLTLHKRNEGRAILDSIRMVRFRDIDEQELAAHVRPSAETASR